MTKKIYHLKTKVILFEGEFGSDVECLEVAIGENIDLSHADLSHKNLCNANLDGLEITSANFSCSNLEGSNISEAIITACNFQNANLINSCIAETVLINCDFSESHFGATILNDSIMRECTFAGLSTLSLPFASLKTLQNCFYNSKDKQIYKISKPPVVIYGLLDVPMACLDDTALIGHSPIPFEVMPSLFKQLDFIPNIEQAIKRKELS